MKILAADYIVPISTKPIANGAVAIENGAIVEVGDRTELVNSFPEANLSDFGSAAIMPGLVNCHSHLELTILRGYLDHLDDDFSSWLLTLTKARAEKLSDSDLKHSAVLGAVEGIKAGVTCFADIGRFGLAGFEALVSSGLRGILFQETDFSPDNRTGKKDFEALSEKFGKLRAKETDLVKTGISPHSPYTVSADLFERIVRSSLKENVPITIHAAESEAESGLMKRGEGFFADIFKRENVHWESPRLTTIEYLANIGVLKSKPLLAHCVTVSEKDIESIAESGSSIAHCPKSNAKFAHGVAPYSEFMDANISVGFGSDSMASNNACDLFEEARFAALSGRTRNGKFIHPKELIETATIGGAKALNMDKSIGTLDIGKEADIIVVSLQELAQQPMFDIYSALAFTTNARDVVFTMVGGQELYNDGRLVDFNEDELILKTTEICRRLVA